MGKQKARVLKLNVKMKNKVRKAAEGCASMPEAVGLHGAVAAVTQQGLGSPCLRRGPVAVSYCRVVRVSCGNMSRRMETSIFLPMGKAINQP